MSSIKYSVYPSIRVIIKGCPESGFDALDFRTQKGLPADLTNRMIVNVGTVTEEEARALVAAGFCLEPSGLLASPAKLHSTFSPCTTDNWGHYAVIPVHAEDSPVMLAIKAIKACFVEQARDACGAAGLEKERSELLARVAEINDTLAGIKC
jgi:hypothetical protein